MVVELNKTKIKNGLAFDGTLSSILTIKMAELGPLKWEPSAAPVKALKKPQVDTTGDTNLMRMNLV